MIQDISPHCYDVTYRIEAAENDDIMLIYHDNKLLCSYNGENIVYPTVGDISAVFAQTKQKAKFLFRIDNINYFELHKPFIEPFDKWDYIEKAEVRAVRPVWRSFAAITGFQIHNWYTNNRFCGRCGERTEPHGKERAVVCKKCGSLKYPQICPSVIVAITHNNKILLTKYAANHSKYKKYSLVAGYNEVGESLEDTIKREVMEEVGLKVKNIRYYKSQPWSFTDTLLVGYFCELDGDDKITLDENELSEARWFEREEIPEESADPTVSLTGSMIYKFKKYGNELQ